MKSPPSHPPTVKALQEPSCVPTLDTPHSTTSTRSALFTTTDSDCSSWAGDFPIVALADARGSRVPIPRLRPPSAQYMQAWRERRGRLQSHIAAGGRNLRSAPQLARRWHPRLRPATVDEAEVHNDESEVGGCDHSGCQQRGAVGLFAARSTLRTLATHRRTASGGSQGHQRMGSSGGHGHHRRTGSLGNSRSAKVGIAPQHAEEALGDVIEAVAAADPDAVPPPDIAPPSAAYMKRWRARHSSMFHSSALALEGRRASILRGFRTARGHVDMGLLAANGPLDGEVCLPLEDPTGIFTPDELALGQRLKREFGGPPSDHKNPVSIATLKCEGGQIRCWRYRQQGDRFDSYVLDVKMSVSLRTALTMTSSQHRKSWDETTKELTVVSMGAPSALTDLHGEPSDEVVLHWCVSAPFPLQSREYILRKRQALLPGDPNQAVLQMMRAGRGPDEGYHKPTPRRTIRVVENTSVNLYWSTSDGGTAFRSMYREDPMVSLPNWLVGTIIDKMLPRGVKALTRSAVAQERKAELRNAAQEKT